MPQMNKGGKFIFGKSQIQHDLSVCFPTQAVAEYNAGAEGKVFYLLEVKLQADFV